MLLKGRTNFINVSMAQLARFPAKLKKLQGKERWGPECMLILHLSDIHFRYPACASPETDPERPYRTRLLQDARARVAKLGPIDAILVGGDIAFGGKPEEYAAALKWLYELADACGCKHARIGAAKAWLSEAASKPDAVARCLCEENITRASTLDALAHAVVPDFVPNDFGDDPWVIALARVEGSPLEKALYLLSFLLARAFGRSTRNCADLVRIAFDKVYAAVERSVLPHEMWRLLDDRLYRSFFWPNWDRCQRIRQTTVNLFVNKDLDPRSFLGITSRDDVFELLVEIAASSYNGQRYLKSVGDHLSQAGSYQERIRTIKNALW